MDAQALVNQAKRIIQVAQNVSGFSVLAEASEFLRTYSGEKSAFLRPLAEVDSAWDEEYVSDIVVRTLEAFVRYVENGLLGGIAIQRQAQIDVVSDFLSQADVLLASKDVHPAAPTVIIGAALEEFLRNWVEEASLGLGSRKPSIDAYVSVLRDADLITKQDHKDITSWAGLRNSAAHGEWEEVSDKRRIALMMEGVNLFMRKYGARTT